MSSQQTMRATYCWSGTLLSLRGWRRGTWQKPESIIHCVQIALSLFPTVLKNSNAIFSFGSRFRLLNFCCPLGDVLHGLSKTKLQGSCLKQKWLAQDNDHLCFLRRAVCCKTSSFGVLQLQLMKQWTCNQSASLLSMQDRNKAYIFWLASSWLVVDYKGTGLNLWINEIKKLITQCNHKSPVWNTKHNPKIHILIHLFCCTSWGWVGGLVAENNLLQHAVRSHILCVNLCSVA